MGDNESLSLSDIPRYLPPVLAFFGAFIPLLVSSALVGQFKSQRILIFSVLGLIIWLSYIATALLGSLVSYSEYLTLCLLVFSIGFLSLTGMKIESQHNPARPRIRQRYIFVLHAISLFFLTSAATNYFGLSSLVLIKLKTHHRIRAVTLVFTNQRKQPIGFNDAFGGYNFVIDKEDFNNLSLVELDDTTTPTPTLSKFSLAKEQTSWALGQSYYFKF